MSEAKPQDGSTVKGYRKLSDAEIAAMNRLKELSRNFIRELRDIQLDLLPQDPVLSDRTAAYRSASLADHKNAGGLYVGMSCGGPPGWRQLNNPSCTEPA